MGKVLDFVLKVDTFMTNGFDGKVARASSALSVLDGKIQKLNRVSGNISGFQKQSQKLEELRQKLAGAQAKVKDMQTARRRGEIIDPKAFTRANEEAAKLRSLVQNNERALGAYRRELQGAGVDTSKLGAEQERLAAKIQQLQRAQERFHSVQSKLTWGNLKADVAKAYAYMKPFQQPIQITMEFDQAMAQVRAVKSMTDEEFSRLENQAMELGASTQFSATQAANTQENLARAGMSIKDITAAMPAVLSMAGAEGMDLAQAGSIIAKGLGGMGLTGDLAPRLADILAYASASSNTNIAMLGEAFKVAAPVFSSQGATMEQVASYLAVLANKGYEGSEAGNALAAAPLRLAKQTGEMKAVFADLGVAVQTRDGRMRELPDLLKAIDASMKLRNYGEVKQLEVVETIFGKNYGKAMMAFMKASAEGQADIMQNGMYTESFGKAAEMNKTRNNTLKGDITSLSSAWEGLMITIGDALTPINRFFTQTLTAAIQRLTQFMREHKGFFDLVIEACYVFGGIKIAGSVLKYFSLGIEYLSAWRAVKIAEKGAELASAAVSAGELGANIGGAASSAKLFGMSLNSALGTLSLIAGACVLIYMHWEDITAAAQRAGEAINSIDRTAPVGELKNSWGNANYHIRQMESMYSVPEVKPYASGGILTRPHIGVVAEAGPEAVIPLSDKSRGIPLLMKAAQILGVQNQNVNNSTSAATLSSLTDASQNLGLQTQTVNKNTSISSLSSHGNIINHERSLNEYVSNRNLRPDYVSNNYSSDSRIFQPPQVNLTVNVTGNESESGDLAARIASAVQEALRNIMSLEERVSYA